MNGNSRSFCVRTKCIIGLGFRTASCNIMKRSLVAKVSNGVGPGPSRRDAGLNPFGKRQRPPVSEAEVSTNCILEHHIDFGLRLQRMSAQVRESGAYTSQSEIHASQRERAVGWLAERFESRRLRDEWCAATLHLLDRVNNWGKTGNIGLAEWLAAILVVLKQGGAEVELNEHLEDDEPQVLLQDVLFEISQVQQKDVWREVWWPRVLMEEIQICSLLDFRLSLPTPLDVSRTFALGVARRIAATLKVSWGGAEEVILPAPGQRISKMPRFVAVADFFVELGIAYARRLEVHRSADLSAVVLPLAAVKLGIRSFEGMTTEILKVFEAATQDFLKDSAAAMALSIAEMEDGLTTLCSFAQGTKCFVIKKWRERKLIPQLEDEDGNAADKLAPSLPLGLARRGQSVSDDAVSTVAVLGGEWSDSFAGRRKWKRFVLRGFGGRILTVRWFPR
jgi:hypothetical protein